MKDELLTQKEVALLLGRHDASWASQQARAGKLKGMKRFGDRMLFCKSAIYEQFGLAGNFEEELSDYMLIGNRAIGEVCRVSGETIKGVIEADPSMMTSKPVFKDRNPESSKRSYQVSKSKLYKWLGLKGNFESDEIEEIRREQAKKCEKE